MAATPYRVTSGGSFRCAIKPGRGQGMEELLRTNDMVLISYIEALLGEAGIPYAVFDQNMSVIEGSLGVLPRRVLVGADALDRARRLLSEAGIGGELPGRTEPGA